MPRQIDSLVLRYAGFALLFLALAFVLYLARGALPVFIVGGLIAYALEPLLQKLERPSSVHQRSRRAAVGLVFAFYLAFLALFFVLLASAFQQGQTFVGNLGDYNRQVLTLIEKNRTRLRESNLPTSVKKSVDEAVESNLEGFNQGVRDAAPNLATAAVTGVGSFLFFLFLVTFISFGLMLEANRLKARLLLLVPPNYRRDALEITESINELLGRYVRGQAIVCVTYGTLLTIAFEILARVYGMQYPLILGISAIFLYVLPYFGYLTIIGLTAITAYLTADSPLPCTAIAVGCCVVFNLLVDYGIAPRVLGRGVGLHPLMVIFALLCGFQIGGPIGTLVAVPIFASLRVVAIYFFPQLAVPLPQSATPTGTPGHTSELVARAGHAEEAPQPPEVESLEETIETA